ncbi:MAG: xylulokinase [Candidatus Hydrogenedentes bacterium]|nr:xylulokinase [Candidatus Hydrogenedentota bacterium]
MAIVLGLDVGTSGTKAIAMDETGKLLASALVEYPLYSPKPNWAEQEPADWKRAALEALSALAARIDTRDVKALGLTGQMHGSVFLDADNAVIRPALLWCDQRTAAQCADITSKVGEARLLEMVSNPALTGFTAPKILWLRDNEPHHYERVRKVLLPKDYIRWVLTSEYATDVADASGTLLFDVKHRCWHQELLSILGIDPALLPASFEGPEITGTLSKAAAAATGLPEGLPVVAGGGDQAAGGVGCGIVRSGVISSSLGTSGVVFAFADQVSTDPKGRVHTFCHSVPGKWHVMGVMLSAGGSLRWYRDELCAPEKAVGAVSGRDPYEYITEEAARVPIGSEGLLFLPYLTGERTPHKDPDAKGAFIGLSLRHTRAHMARAVLEGVAFGMRDSLEIIREMGVSVSEVRASGGGARSVLWQQILADTGNAPMVTINVDEGPAYGAAILSSVAAGMFSTVEEGCDAIIREVSRRNPDPAAVTAYEPWYQEFKSTYTACAPGFKRVAKLL